MPPMLLSTLLVLWCAAAAWATEDDPCSYPVSYCPYPFTRVRLECFYLSPSPATWSSARTKCKDLGGDLAIPDDVTALDNFVFPAADTDGVWIGGTDQDSEGDWHYLNGGPIPDGAWSTTDSIIQPDDGSGREDCLELRSYFDPPMNDYTCDTQQQYVCEIDLPSPSPCPCPGILEPKCVCRYRNCYELLQSVGGSDGLYVIYPYDSSPERPVRVWCDMTTDGGGWTVIQRRGDYKQQENFYRTWIEYALGFGEPSKDHWLGLDHIHAITDQQLNQIHFQLSDFEGNSTWAKYEVFYVHDRSASYKLEVNSYNGTAGDSFARHSGYMFSAKDKDLDVYDGECAVRFKGAWWYTKCHASNLNGQYLSGEHESYADGVNWWTWHGHHYSLKDTTMMIRPSF